MTLREFIDTRIIENHGLLDILSEVANLDCKLPSNSCVVCGEPARSKYCPEHREEAYREIRRRADRKHYWTKRKMRKERVI